ncbi:Uncharacterized protein HZ326_24724 [Fusarium oxysporum f. sp. albedinis]|nr:Uncharacterized protein HZ326_24724 [Fusarium oxysporum f. sp. albedinis]
MRHGSNRLVFGCAYRRFIFTVRPCKSKSPWPCLETGTLNLRVKAFYTATNAPQLKAAISPCDRHCWSESTGVIPSTGLSLFDYV